MIEQYPKTHLTDAQLRATPVPISGALTDAQLRATPVPISGALTDAQLRATPVPVSGTLTVDAAIGDGDDAALGATTDAAVITDANGTVSAKLRGLVKLASEAATPFELRVAQGLVSGMSAINKFGRNPDIDIGTEDIWSVGGLFVLPTPGVVSVVSSSASDAAAGVGARTLTISGLNGTTYAEQTETITLNGVGAVTTAASFAIIHRMIVATAGSSGTNVGTLTTTIGGTASGNVVAGKGQTQLGFYMIPAGKTGYLTRYGGSIDGSSTASIDLELFATPFGGALNLKGTIMFLGSGTTAAYREYTTPLVFTEKTLIRLRATSDTNNVDVVGNFDLCLGTN